MSRISVKLYNNQIASRIKIIEMNQLADDRTNLCADKGLT